MKLKILYLLVFCFLFNVGAKAQNDRVLWQEVTSFDYSSSVVYPRALPVQSKIFQLEETNFKTAISQAPTRASRLTSKVIVKFPNAEGKLESFRVKEASVMTPEHQAKHPNIKSYVGVGINNPYARVRFSISPNKGLNAMIRSNKKTVFIEPYSRTDEQYVVFVRSVDDNIVKDFVCEVSNEDDFSLLESTIDETKLGNANDGKLRTYRLALACTGEYTQHHGGTKQGALEAMNTTMTRVNGIYEIDLGVKLEMVNNSEIIYTSASSDPYSNSSGDISKNTGVINGKIGSENYDIGHVFGKGSGGVAYLGCVCNSNKGGGVTGSNVPEGDPYDVDYVAHEMGHQFGANHIQNNSARRCNSVAKVGVEPGSGSTIMGYAGVCPPDVQKNSDPYFNIVSIKEIWARIESDCSQKTDTGNKAPKADAGSDYSIPKSTPFVLKGSATDENDDRLTYCWEQADAKLVPNSSLPPSSTSTGAIFRSLNPKDSEERFLPDVELLISGASNEWEVLPSTSRTINFNLTVRDNYSGGGNTDTDAMKVTVTNSGPFTVDTPSGTWETGTKQTVTWKVAGTNASPINCKKVGIYITVDGGKTFVKAIESTDNDGSEEITVPKVATSSQAILMVRAADNIFYNISGKFNTTLGINDFTWDNLEIYPNPNEGKFTVRFNTLSKKDVQLSLYDVRGRKVMNKSYAYQSAKFNKVVNLEAIKTGIYLLKINDGEKSIVKRIIVE